MNNHHNNNSLLNTAIELFQEYRLESVDSGLHSNEDFIKSSEKISKALKSVPYQNAFEIDGAYIEQIAIAQEVMYKQGFQDGINLMQELIGERQVPISKKSYTNISSIDNKSLMRFKEVKVYESARTTGRGALSEA